MVVVSSLLKVQNISKKYENNSYPLKDVSFNLGDKEIAAILGPRGSGKTTLFNIISSSIEPTKGKIYLNNKEITNQNMNLKKELGILYPQNNLFSEFSVSKNIEFPLNFTDMDKNKKNRRVNQLLKKLGLKKLKDSSVDNLALSDKIKIELARAVSHKPALVLMDETLHRIDINLAVHILNQIKNLSKEGISFLIFTDNPEISKHTNTFFKLKNGKLGR